jgi:hypothetical protein
MASPSVNVKIGTTINQGFSDEAMYFNRFKLVWNALAASSVVHDERAAVPSNHGDELPPTALALPGGNNKHYLYILEYVFPEPPFTVEGWINVANGYSGDYWFSFASSPDYGNSNSNCLLVRSKPGKYDEWVHWAMTVSATGSINQYVNGNKYNTMRYSSKLCKKGGALVKKGALILGQEQDAYHGGFDKNQAPKMKIDRIGVIPKLLSTGEMEAIYNGEPYAGEFYSNWKMCGSGFYLLMDSGTSKQDLIMGGTVPETDDAVTGCTDASTHGEGWSNVAWDTQNDVDGVHGPIDNKGYIERTFELPAHSQLSISTRVWAVDSWDSEWAFIEVDGFRKWELQLTDAHQCTTGWSEYHGDFYDPWAGHSAGHQCYADVNLFLRHHSSSSITVKIGTSIDQGFEDEAMYFGQFVLAVGDYGDVVHDEKKLHVDY